MYNGYSFSTGNSTVGKLPIGSELKVSSQGTLTVTKVAPPPVKTYTPGQRIYTKHGYATVVRVTDRLSDVSNLGFNAGSQVLYVADGSPVVRVVNKSEL